MLGYTEEDDSEDNQISLQRVSAEHSNSLLSSSVVPAE